MPRLNHNEITIIGSIGGLKIQLRRTVFNGKQGNIELSGHALYEAELGDTPLGIISSLESQLRRMEERLASAAVSEQESSERLTHLKQTLDGGFQHAEKLAQLRRKQSLLNEELQSSQGDTMAVSEETNV